MKYEELLTKLFQWLVFVYFLLDYAHTIYVAIEIADWELLRQKKPGKPCAYRLREIAANETNASNASNDGYDIDALSLDSR